MPLHLPVPPPALRNPEGQLAVADWTLTSEKIHLNHGSFGAVPRAAQTRQRELQDHMEANPCTWFKGMPPRIAAARTEIAAFLRVDQSELALVANASAGMSAIYNSLPFAEGVEIVATNHGYGAVTQGAARIARRHNGTLRIAEVPLDANAPTVVELVMAEVNERTGLIVIDQVTSATARSFPVTEIAAAAARRGVPVLVDGAHAPGVLAEPVPDFEGFWVGNLHKFGCAPRGTAALVARGPLPRHLTPLIDSWGYPYHFPQNFDHVGTQDVTAWLAAGTAFESIGERFGWDALRDYSAALADYGAAIIGRAFGDDSTVDVGMPVGPLRLVRLPEGLQENSEATRSVLSELGFETAITSFDGVGYLRLSAHAYNTAADYEAFAERAVPALVELARSRT